MAGPRRSSVAGRPVVRAIPVCCQPVVKRMLVYPVPVKLGPVGELFDFDSHTALPVGEKGVRVVLARVFFVQPALDRPRVPGGFGEISASRSGTTDFLIARGQFNEPDNESGALGDRFPILESPFSARHPRCLQPDLGRLSLRPRNAVFSGQGQSCGPMDWAIHGNARRIFARIAQSPNRDRLPACLPNSPSAAPGYRKPCLHPEHRG